MGRDRGHGNWECSWWAFVRNAHHKKTGILKGETRGILRRGCSAMVKGAHTLVGTWRGGEQHRNHHGHCYGGPLLCLELFMNNSSPPAHWGCIIITLFWLKKLAVLSTGRCQLGSESGLFDFEVLEHFMQSIVDSMSSMVGFSEANNPSLSGWREIRNPRYRK